MSLSSPKLSFQPPPGKILYTYNLNHHYYEQDPSIPPILLSSFSVRENVFVEKQRNVPFQHHIDSDDMRSCHWVLSSPTGKAIGTIRLVPYPHHPLPLPGAQIEAPTADIPAPSSVELFSTPVPEYKHDRATTLYDGIEPYLKLGRLCVVEEERGRGYAGILIQAALTWAKENPGFAKEGLTAEEKDNIPDWKGLLGIDASQTAAGVWRRNGFEIDEEMGTWLTAKLPHVGMFCRVQIEAGPK